MSFSPTEGDLAVDVSSPVGNDVMILCRSCRDNSVKTKETVSFGSCDTCGIAVNLNILRVAGHRGAVCSDCAAYASNCQVCRQSILGGGGAQEKNKSGTFNRRNKDELKSAISNTIAPRRDIKRAVSARGVRTNNRPSWHVEPEELEMRLRASNEEKRRLEQEVSALKIASHRSEELLRKKNRLVEDLMRNRPIEGARLSEIKDTLKANAEIKIVELERLLEAKEAEINLVKMRNAHISKASSQPGTATGGGGGRYLEETGGSMASAMASAAAHISATPARSKGDRTMRGEAKQQAQQIEKLNELLQATEIVAEANERRVAELERELSQLRGGAVPVTGIAAAAAGLRSMVSPTASASPAKPRTALGLEANLHTEDNGDFDSYLQGLVDIERRKQGLAPENVTMKSKAAMSVDVTKADKDTSMYQVVISSGPHRDAIPTSSAYVVIKGTQGTTHPIELPTPTGGWTRGGIDKVQITGKSVGNVTNIRIGHDNSGDNPRWFVEKVTIMLPFGPNFMFHADRWLAEDTDDRRCYVDLSDPAVTATGAFGEIGIGMPVSPQKLGGAAARRSMEKSAAAPKKFVDAVYAVHADRHHGLVALGDVVGAKVSVPTTGRKVQILLLGNSGGASRYIEHVTGKRMQNTGLGTETHFTLISSGSRSTVVQGAEALAQMPQSTKLSRIMGLEKCVHLEELGTKGLANVNYICGPHIEGKVTGGGLTPSQDILQQVRWKIAAHSSSLMKEFQKGDVNGDGLISRAEFSAAIGALNLGLKESEIMMLFDVLDVTNDGDIEYDEFLSAFRQKTLEYPYDVEQSMMSVAEGCDVVMCFVDPKELRLSLRELTMYQRLHERFKSKLSFFFYVRPSLLTKKDLPIYTKATAQAMATQLKESTLQRTPTWFIQSDLEAGKVATVDNGLMLVTKHAQEEISKQIGIAVDDVALNVVQIASKVHSMAAKDQKPTKGKDRNEAEAELNRRAAIAAKARVVEVFKYWDSTLGRAEDNTVKRLKAPFERGLRVVREGAGTFKEDVVWWSSEQVASWLKKQGMEIYNADILERRVSGKQLLRMCEGGGGKLGEEFGMTLGHRKVVAAKFTTMSRTKHLV